MTINVAIDARIAPGFRDSHRALAIDAMPSWAERVPCDGCEHHERCADRLLACAAFARFVLSGQATSPTTPNRAVYDRVFSGEDFEHE